MEFAKKKSSVQEQVYSKIKNAIITGEFLPGEKLKEVKVAEMLSTSRTPIREAFRRLEQEEFITYSQSQGATVSKISIGKVIDLYECRSSLESLAAKKAAECIHEDQLNTIEENLILSKQFYSEGDFDKVIKKNTVFHDTIVEASQNEILIKMMEQIRSQLLRYRMLIFKEGYQFRPTFLDEHTKIYEAIKNRDSDKSSQLMEHHIKEDLEAGLNALKKLGIF